MASAGDARPLADRFIKRADWRCLDPSLADDVCSKRTGTALPAGGRAVDHAGCGHNRRDAEAGEPLTQDTVVTICIMCFNIQKFRILQMHYIHVVGRILIMSISCFLTELIFRPF